MKWYWFIPLVGLFFIESQADWVYNQAGAKRGKMATIAILLGLLVQCFFVALLSYHLIFKSF